MKKVICLVSNRASFYRQKYLLLKMRDVFDLKLILTSSLLEPEYVNTYTEIHRDFSHVNIPIPSYDGSLSSMSDTSTTLLAKANSLLSKDNCDCFMLLADRWELLPFAMIAAYKGIPIAHIQGGEVSGNIDDKVRHAVSQLSDIHFVSHNYAKTRLEMMGLKNIYNTGCPSADIILFNKISRKTIKNHIICCFHPHTKEIKKANEQALTVVKAVLEFCVLNNIDVKWFAPNNDPGFLEVLGNLKSVELIHNLVGEDFLRLLSESIMIVGNTSACIREASLLDVPAVVIGERQAGREMDKNAIHIEVDHDKIINAMRRSENKKINFLDKPAMFGLPGASQDIINILTTYLGE